MAEFLMPILTADMSAGTLVAWRKKPGDAITRGDVVITLHAALGVEIPEADYPKLATLAGCVDYVLSTTSSTGPTTA